MHSHVVLRATDRGEVIVPEIPAEIGAGVGERQQQRAQPQQRQPTPSRCPAVITATAATSAQLWRARYSTTCPSIEHARPERDEQRQQCRAAPPTAARSACSRERCRCSLKMTTSCEVSMRLPPPNTPIQNMYSRKCGSLRRISNNMPRLNGSVRPTAAFSSASSANSRRTRAARYNHAASKPGRRAGAKQPARVDDLLVERPGGQRRRERDGQRAHDDDAPGVAADRRARIVGAPDRGAHREHAGPHDTRDQDGGHRESQSAERTRRHA